jgi:prepilin-type N-terminal cleavage/methylation domain-containing protein
MSSNQKCPRPPPRAAKRARRGSRLAFTLLEVLVATSILAVGIVGVLAVFSLSIRAASTAEQLDTAVRLATNRLELAVAVPAGGIRPDSGSAGRFKWTVTYTDKPHRLVLATVQVTWTDGGQPQTYQLSQLFMPAS